jgi:hypothetical protein
MRILGHAQLKIDAAAPRFRKAIDKNRRRYCGDCWRVIRAPRGLESHPLFDVTDDITDVNDDIKDATI